MQITMFAPFSFGLLRWGHSSGDTIPIVVVFSTVSTGSLAQHLTLMDSKIVTGVAMAVAVYCLSSIWRRTVKHRKVRNHWKQS